MGFHEAFYEELEGIAQNVDGNARAYPMGDMPADAPDRFITFDRTSNEHVRHLGGGSGLTTASYLVACWGGSTKDVHELHDAVRERLDNKRGEIGGANNTHEVRGIFLANDTEDYVPPTDMTTQGRHAVVMELTIVYGETVTPI
jgi:hypothetical protein